jgi:hypothetical protein
MHPLVAFARDLLERGQVTIAPDEFGTIREASALEDHELEAIHAEADTRLRAHAPATAPELTPRVATSALRSLWLLCYALRARSEDREEALREARLTSTSQDSSAHWSADIYLRHLPYLDAQLRQRPTTDPLRVQVEALGVEFPLSGLLLPGPLPREDKIPKTTLDMIRADACLRRIWRDRFAIRKTLQSNDSKLEP